MKIKLEVPNDLLRRCGVVSQYIGQAKSFDDLNYVYDCAVLFAIGMSKVRCIDMQGF